MKIEKCDSSFIYLAKVDEDNFKQSHILRVESVKRINGKDAFVIPDGYENCEVSGSESRCREAIAKRFKSTIENALNGLRIEEGKLIDELNGCGTQDAFSLARRKKILDELDKLHGTENELTLMKAYRFKVQVFSSRNLENYSFNSSGG